MTCDVVCFYADLGRPYAPLIERMTRTAKHAMPDCRTVLLTPNAPQSIIEMFDTAVALSRPANALNLCLERVRAMATWATITEQRTVFVDPDIEFRSAPQFDGSFDIGLLWRTTKPDQPINTGAILAEPGPKFFWKHYAAVAVNLPEQIHGWFCDQLAFALLTGICRKADERLQVDDARVWLMDAKHHCYKPGVASEKAWAVHYKGATKGEGWDRIFKSDAKSGAGNSSPASASAMAGAQA